MTAKIITAEEVAEHYAPLLDLYGALLALEEARAENERLRLKLEQASNNLKAGAKRYECPGLAVSARLAFEALEKQP